MPTWYDGHMVNNISLCLQGRILYAQKVLSAFALQVSKYKGTNLLSHTVLSSKKAKFRDFILAYDWWDYYHYITVIFEKG